MKWSIALIAALVGTALAAPERDRYGGLGDIHGKATGFFHAGNSK